MGVTHTIPTPGRRARAARVALIPGIAAATLGFCSMPLPDLREPGGLHPEMDARAARLLLGLALPFPWPRPPACLTLAGLKLWADGTPGVRWLQGWLVWAVGAGLHLHRRHVRRRAGPCRGELFEGFLQLSNHRARPAFSWVPWRVRGTSPGSSQPHLPSSQLFRGRSFLSDPRGPLP